MTHLSKEPYIHLSIYHFRRVSPIFTSCRVAMGNPDQKVRFCKGKSPTQRDLLETKETHLVGALMEKSPISVRLFCQRDLIL